MLHNEILFFTFFFSEFMMLFIHINWQSSRLSFWHPLLDRFMVGNSYSDISLCNEAQSFFDRDDTEKDRELYPYKI